MRRAPRASSSPRVIVIGAGVVGAAIAWRLSLAGARVLLSDREDAPGRGVSAASFGWVTTMTSDPGPDETPTADALRLHREAFGRWRRFNEDLGGRLFGPPPGALVWASTPEETNRLLAAHGETARRVESPEIRRVAPLLAAPPEFAAFSPESFALDPADAARTMAAAAVEAGAEAAFGACATALFVEAGAVRGVRFGGDEEPADFVVVAAGGESGGLLAPFAPAAEVALRTSPAALIEIDADAAAFGAILSGPELEIRARDPRTLILAEWAPTDHCEAARRRLGEDALAAVRRLLPGTRARRARAVKIAARPMTAEGRPLAGRVAGPEGLLAAVAHPGVILAPGMAQAIEDAVFEREARPDFNIV